MKPAYLLPFLIILLSIGVLFFSGQFDRNNFSEGRDAANATAPARITSAPLPAINLVLTIVCAGTAVALFLLLLRVLGGPTSSGMPNPLRASAIGLATTFLFFLTVLTLPVLRATLVQMIYDPSGICQTILAITLLGFSANLMQFLFLAREYGHLCSLQDWTPPDQEGRDNEIAKRLDPLLERLPDGCVMKQKWLAMHQTAPHREWTEFETLMSFADMQEILKESRLAFCIKLLPLLGLIGTVMGFVIAVTGMQQAAAGMADFSSFKGNMLGALGGMKTAFLTTLAGMVGMVLLMMVNSLITEARKRILIQQNELLYTRIFTVFPRKRNDAE